MEKKIKVLYIAGMGRTGSTILERSMGQMEEYCSIGELRFIWEKNIHTELCGCGEPFSKCKFWTSVADIAYEGIESIPRMQITQYQDIIEKNTLLPRMLFDWGGDLDKKASDYGKQYLELYRAIDKVNGGKIIIDASKDLRTLYVLRRIKEIDLSVLHLIRNPNGVAYSWTKKYKRTDIIDRDVYMHVYSPYRTTYRWISRNMFLSLTHKIFNRYIRIHYEDFVSDPVRILNSILKINDIKERSFSFIQGKQLLLEIVNHTVSGNPFRFTKDRAEFKLDEEWKTKLPLHVRIFISIVTWPMDFYYQIKRNSFYIKKTKED